MSITSNKASSYRSGPDCDLVRSRGFVARLLIGQVRALRLLRGIIVVVWAAVLSAGCNRPATKPAVAPPAPPQRQDALQPALETLRQAREARHFRDGLNLVNAHLTHGEGQHDLHLTETTRSFLKDTIQLDAAELEEIDAGSFRPLDAVHLDSSFLFAEVARSLDVGHLPPLDQAAAAFGWTMRRVVLHQQHDDGVPTYLVAKRGYGGPRDRALVFLELLRQLKLDGCVIALPAAADEAEALLVGVLIPKGKDHDVALFDVRLGMPIRAERGIATLGAAKANPKLVDADWKKAEVRLAFALQALAPRMKFLEEALAAQERIALYQDAEALHKQVAAATGLKVAPWPSGTPPWRLDRQFFPTSEGGIDKTGRLPAFMTQLLPFTGARAKLEEMRLSEGLLPKEAANRLLVIVFDLLTKYYQEPREMLLRGQHDAALKRLDRINEVIAQDREARQLDEAQFQRDIAQWREKLIQFDAEQNLPAFERMWHEDLYLVAVRSVEAEKSPQEFERKLLTHIVLRACREQLAGAVDSIKAAIWEDKAARFEVHRGEGKASPGLEEKVANAWRNTAGALGIYLDRHDLGPAQQRQRLADIARQFQAGQLDFALAGLEQLHLDLSRLWDARLRQAHAQQRLGQSQAAAATLKQVQSSLQPLTKDSDLKKLMDDLAAEPQLAPPLARRVALLHRDWTLRGNFYWVGRRAETLQGD
jgi:hypothetical protein